MSRRTIFSRRFSQEIILLHPDWMHKMDGFLLHNSLRSVLSVTEISYDFRKHFYRSPHSRQEEKVDRADFILILNLK